MHADAATAYICTVYHDERGAASGYLHTISYLGIGATDEELVADRQTYFWTDRQVDRQMGEQMDRQTDRQTDR